jgi:8-amino-7-oxononanoate synthase
MPHEPWIHQELNRLREEHLLRTARLRPSTGGRFVLDGRPILNFSSNDYLDLARDARVVNRARRALEEYGAGSTASRLIAGTLPVHEELERALAALERRDAALVFGSGFLAAAGLLTALVGRGDWIVADKLIHACLIDGARLSGAGLKRFRHNDPDHLETVLRTLPAAGRRVIAVESVYSMDGDLCPLPAVARLAEQYECDLVIDEAHATGVAGPGGAGRAAECGLAGDRLIALGTLSKALGGYGGFVACSSALRDLLVNRARSFIYTTALPPASAGAALGALEILRAEPHRGPILRQRAARFRAGLRAAGFDTLGSETQIVPVQIGDNRRALDLSASLEAEGVLAVAIRPPTVPVGTARLRLSVTLAHEDADLDRAVDLLTRAAGRPS